MNDKEKIEEALVQIKRVMGYHTLTCVNCVENLKILKDLKKFLKS